MRNLVEINDIIGGDGDTAVISDCGRYRYFLRRGTWRVGMVCFICLNPSTADATKDDATVRRLRGFAEDWGYSGFCLVNLYAWRATQFDIASKDKAGTVDDRRYIGEENDMWLERAAARCYLAVAAWGGKAGKLRASNVAAALKMDGLHCLRLTKSGHPAHPLYLPRTCKPKPFAGYGWPGY